jgi:hypothetical protein
MKYSYRTEVWSPDWKSAGKAIDSLDQVLNRMGADGWRLHHVVQGAKKKVTFLVSSAGYWFLVFEKES